MPEPFTMALIASTGASALSSIAAGKSAELTSRLDSYNTETDGVLAEAEARARSNRRNEEYQANLSSNIASFAAMGRDVGSDRSVGAFLKKQKEVVGKDIARSDRAGEMESRQAIATAAGIRSEGKAAKRAGYVQAFTTIAGGTARYYEVK